ncbi:competence protein ComK [Siminovitchia sediminis]|uniref:Competence protein ComK n=1 Tax=Siminovitchia sediminis TaxID=1274353 RepID=A0ABW4KJP7_9BACI
MEMKEFYFIKRLTYVLIPIIVEHGYIYTKVIEGPRVFLVKLPPLQIIKNSMQHYGHGWEGANKAAKAALGKIDMPPVKICGKLGIYWFPSKSPYADDCIWFALDPIKDRIPITSKETKILFPFHQHVTVPLSLEQFTKRRIRTYDLKSIYEKRTEEESYFWPYMSGNDMPIVHESFQPYHATEEQIGDLDP